MEIVKTVDNFKIIGNILKFEDRFDFYFLQIIQRKKDGNQVPSANNGFRTIKTYYIRSLEDFYHREEAIKDLCRSNNARAYINVTPRNATEIALAASKEYITLVEEGRADQGYRVYDRMCGKFSKKKTRDSWVIDIDFNDPVAIDCVENAICKSTSRNEVEPGVYDNIIAWVPTVSGLHLITCGFNIDMFKENLKTEYGNNKKQIQISYEEIMGIEIKKNNPTLLFFEKIRED